MIKYDSKTKQIQINRGDSTSLVVSAKDNSGETYTFKNGDVVKLKVAERKNESNVVLEKSIEITEDTTSVTIPITTSEMKIGEIINKPVTYWYEISVETTGGEVQTIIGYSEDGPAEFVLNPEAGDLNA